MTAHLLRCLLPGPAGFKMYMPAIEDNQDVFRQCRPRLAQLEIWDDVFACGRARAIAADEDKLRARRPLQPRRPLRRIMHLAVPHYWLKLGELSTGVPPEHCRLDIVRHHAAQADQ